MALEPRNRQEDWYQEMIDAIGEGGGSGLPEVTSADNGNVLTVKNGAWATGKSVYIISSHGSTADIGASEILALANEGMLPVLNYLTYYYVYTHTSGNAYFIRVYYNNGNLCYDYASVSANKQISRGLSTVVYQKPTDGIPETDLAAAVRDKLTRGNNNIMQIIPVELDGTNFTVHLMPMDIDDGYTLTYEQGGETRSATFPAFRDSSYTQIMLYLTGSQWTEGMRFAVTPDYSNADGVTFHTQIVAFDGIGLTGYVGVLTIKPDHGYDANYTATIHYWQDAAAQ